MLPNVVFISFFVCLFLWEIVTDVFLLRGIGNLWFCVLKFGWDRNELLYPCTLDFSTCRFQVLALLFV